MLLLLLLLLLRAGAGAGRPGHCHARCDNLTSSKVS
jgi:hypothetical protein